MNLSTQKLAIVFLLLLAGCSSNGGNNKPSKKDYGYECTITWDGYTPSAVFTNKKDPTQTSEEIATMFIEKESRKVLQYPSNAQRGIREHRVEYVYVNDAQLKFESSTNNEEFDQQNVDINEEKVLNYLRATTLETQYQSLLATKNESHDTSHYTLNVPRYGNEQTSIVLASDEEFTTDVSKYLTETDSYTFDYLIPGNSYYWKASGKTSDVEFDGGLFKVNEDNIRFGNFDRVGNMRDLGGWKTGTNSRIKYNMIVRGRNPDSLNTTQKNEITEAYGFKTQIDLRSDGDGPINVRICPGVNYYYTNTSLIYNQVLENLNVKAGVCETPDEDNGRRLTYGQLLAKIFDILAQETSYPLYFHCIHGADRTGTLAVLIEGLLGVSEEDIVKDYELTSFNSKSGQRLRGKGNADNTSFAVPLEDSSSGYGLQHLFASLRAYSGNTLKDKIENFLTSEDVGVPDSTITAIRNLLIEEI